MTQGAVATAILSVLPVWQVFGQSPAPPAFEVADIKVSSSKGPRPGKGGMLPGGRIDLPNATIKDLVIAAYGVQKDMISGAPNWLDSDRFDIVAKAPPNTPVPTLMLMLQTLLEERFKLAMHREDKQMPAYVLSVAKGGSKLQQSAEAGRQTCAWTMPGNGLRRRECHNMTMAELARQLPGWGGIGIDRPVVDLTELKGAYDLQLDIGMPGNRGGEGDANPLPAPEDSGPTIFGALAKVGLKLESQKRVMPIVVIDHVERIPTDN